tara:strand:+ start:17815 stop:18624 length:810 start_codon:yes stop_codon:yes gene_type:complete
MNNQYTEEDYKWLAQFGRNGDDQIREIEGEPQHVNTYEAYLVDHYGKEGEAAVDLMGSGTINPETGLEENFWWVVGAALAAVAVNYTSQNDGSLSGFKIGDLWNYSVGNQGIGGELLGYGDKQDMRNQASSVVNEGMESLQEQANQNLGGDGEKGFIDVNADFARSEQQLAGKQANRKIENMAGQTGLASSGTIAQEQNDALREQTDKARQINFDTHREKQDYVTGLKEKSNQLKMDYMTATGKAWGGSEDWNDLNNMFQQYNDLTYTG